MVKRTLRRQVDRETCVVELHYNRRVLFMTDSERLGLDTPEEIEDPAVLQPHLIVEEAS